MIKGVLLVCALLGLVSGAGAVLNVHVIAHTHDDTGWLKTVDEYYYGANNTIQDARVQFILDTVVQQLQVAPHRRFIYVEIAFFMRWWREQDEGTRSVVRDLVDRGQLEFCNGGWVMNDEACTYYPSIINQMTEGHRFLFENFGVYPTIGWQIDPFGHSSSMATMFAEMGFNGFFFARADYQDYTDREDDQELEFIWRSSTSLGKQVDIFTHIDYTNAYCNFPLYEWDTTPPIKFDPELEGYDLPRMADEFKENVDGRVKAYRGEKTNNVMISFGCDYAYSDARINFKNMDYLMDYINKNQHIYGLNVFYSTPATYVEHLHEESKRSDLSWSLNEHDFFPYVDRPYAVWAGYFTSREALKGYVRSRNALEHDVTTLMAGASAVIPTSLTTKNFANVRKLAQANGLVQHHDAVTGTERKRVADDYAKRLAIGSADVMETMSDVIGALYVRDKHGSAPQFENCRLLNLSICPATDGLGKGQNALPVVLYNSLGYNRVARMRIPVPVTNVEVVDERGLPITSQVFVNADKVNILAFEVDMPAMALKSVVIQTTGSSVLNGQSKRASVDPYVNAGGDIVLENEFVKAVFSESTGRLASYTNKLTGIQASVDQAIMWYNASAGNNVNSTQPSGAYIFRPNGTTPHEITPNSKAAIKLLTDPSDSPVVQALVQQWSYWAYQTVRLYQGAEYLEFELNVGEIPIADRFGKEVISRFTTSLTGTDGTYYTDANGLEFQKRKRNYRYTYKLNNTEVVADNYYPINTAIYMEDGDKRITLVNSQSCGGGSINDGQFEVMVHRRLLYDDHRGVGQPLNQTDIVRTKEWISIDHNDDGARKQRRLSLEMNYPVKPLFAANWKGDAKEWFDKHTTEFKILTKALPENVHLATLRIVDDLQAMVRLHHVFGKDEDPVLSKDVTVDLGQLFENLEIVKVEEVSLTTVIPIDDVERYTWKLDNGEGVNGETKWNVIPVEDQRVTLKPMEFRSFMIQFLHA